jgi:hypothetical protein
VLYWINIDQPQWEGIMPTFEVKVVVRAYRSTRIEVEATDWEDAEAKAEAMYYDGKVDFIDDYETEDLECEVEEEIES